MVINIKIKINNEEKNLDLLNDFIFKKIFGESGCEKDTLYIINTITERNFKTLTYLPTEMEGEHNKHKKSSTDVLVGINQDVIVNIECQKQIQDGFHRRSHFYNNRIQSIFLTAGDHHKKLPLAIMINILDFNIKEPAIQKLKNYHNTFIPCEKNQRQYSLDDITETHFVELPKFRKNLKKGNIDLNNPKDRLMVILDVKSPENLIKKVIKMDSFAKNVYNKAERLLQDRDGYLAYIKADQAERDKEAQLRYGEEKGKKEEKVEIAIKLKNKGYSLEEISEITALTIDFIEKL